MQQLKHLEVEVSKFSDKEAMYTSKLDYLVATLGHVLSLSLICLQNSMLKHQKSESESQMTREEELMLQLEVFLTTFPTLV
jgi:hypothetical protein